MVVDGTAKEPFKADIAVSEGRIIDIGDLLIGEDVETLNAEGLMVAPGFIDMHSHSDFTLLMDPRAVSSITQGVTMEVIGNCGYGCSPIVDSRLAKEVIYGYREDLPFTWHDMAGYLERLEQARPAVNVITLVPNGQLRLATVGLEMRPAQPDELEEMKRLLHKGLEQGGHGYSTGLEYATEVGATEKEITELCRVCSKYDGLYATHVRNRDEAALEAVVEAIRTAENAGVRLQISHITPRSGRDDAERSLELVDEAQARGNEVTFDMHTRLFGTTYLKVILPPWALEGDKDAIARRLSDPAEREKMKSHRSAISALGDWNRIVLLDNPALPELSRHSLGEIAQERGKDAFDCAYDILLTEIDQLHRPMIILHSYTEEILRLTYEHSGCMIGSDATALAPDGPLAGSVFHGAYTWASWFYRRMARETGTFTPAQAIHKMTGLTAGRFGLSDRGIIRKGAHADFAIFDPDEFGDTGTTFEPNQIAKGMVHVLVNGVVTIRDAMLTGERGGKVLRPNR
jgi:N-acyl-D-aspartate/D-glutamate deacylase